MKIEYRTPAGSGSYATLADEGAGALAERIKGYQPRLTKQPMVSPLFQSVAPLVADLGNGTWALAFAVDRVHASPDAAALFLVTHPAVFNVVSNFDLKITVGAQVVYFPACVMNEFTPEPHSDQSTVCKYGWTGGSYTTTAP